MQVHSNGNICTSKLGYSEESDLDRLTQEKVQEILQVYEREKSYEGTARIVGVVANTVRDHVNIAREKSEAHRAIEEGNEDKVALKVYSLLESGKSMIQVALVLGLRSGVVEKYHVEYRRLKVQDSLIRLYNLLREKGFESGFHPILDLAEEVIKGNYTEDQVKETLRKVATPWKLDDEIKSLFGARDQAVEEWGKADEKLDKVNSELDEKNELAKGADKKIADLRKAEEDLAHERREAQKIPPSLLTEEGRSDATQFIDRRITTWMSEDRTELIHWAIHSVIYAIRSNPEVLDYFQNAASSPDDINPPMFVLHSIMLLLDSITEEIKKGLREGALVAGRVVTGASTQVSKQMPEPGKKSHAME